MTARFYSENIHSNPHLSYQEFNPQTSWDPRINHLRSERHNSSFLPSISDVSTSLHRNLAVCSVGNAGYSALLLYSPASGRCCCCLQSTEGARYANFRWVRFTLVFRLTLSLHSSTVRQTCTNYHGHTTILCTTRVVRTLL